MRKAIQFGPEKNKKNGTIDKAYTLFTRVINETNKIAIGKVVLKDREHIIALRAYQRGIVMHQLRYIDEVKPVDEVEGIDESLLLPPNNHRLTVKNYHWEKHW